MDKNAFEQLRDTSSEVWKEFKAYCEAHDQEEEEAFYMGLMNKANELDDKYRGLPTYGLEYRLMAGLMESYSRLMRETNGN